MKEEKKVEIDLGLGHIQLHFKKDGENIKQFCFHPTHLLAAIDEYEKKYWNKTVLETSTL